MQLEGRIGLERQRWRDLEAQRNGVYRCPWASQLPADADLHAAPDVQQKSLVVEQRTAELDRRAEEIDRLIRENSDKKVQPLAQVSLFSFLLGCTGRA
jgi:hypothetical protein